MDKGALKEIYSKELTGEVESNTSVKMRSTERRPGDSVTFCLHWKYKYDTISGSIYGRISHRYIHCETHQL